MSIIMSDYLGGYSTTQLPYHQSDIISHPSPCLSLTGYPCLAIAFDYEQWKTLIRNNTYKELLHRNSSHPFSSQNFSKTRPRGLAVQESFVKFIPSFIYLLPPLAESGRFEYYGWVLTFTNSISQTWTIRPPPFC